jgi:hypothetical protein
METTFYSISRERDCGQAIFRVKELLYGWNISTAPHGADLRHSAPLMQGGQTGEFFAPVIAEGGFPDILVGGKEVQLVPGKGILRRHSMPIARSIVWATIRH